MDDGRGTGVTQGASGPEGRLRQLGFLALIGFAAVAPLELPFPGPTAKVVEAEEFVLRDAAGNARLQFDRGSFAMDARRRHGVPGGHAEVDDVRDRLHHPGDDAVAARRADRHQGSVIVGQDAGA